MGTKIHHLQERTVTTMNFNVNTLTETQKNALFAFGEKNKVGTGCNLMIAARRIAAICSNIGVATVVRVKPELADHEHLYYEALPAGGNEWFDTAIKETHDRYFSMLENLATEE